MVVRVKIRVRHGGKSVVTSAIINTGFESDEPEIILPRRLAEELGVGRR